MDKNKILSLIIPLVLLLVSALTLPVLGAENGGLTSYTIICTENNDEQTIIHQETISDVAVGKLITVQAPTIKGFTVLFPESRPLTPGAGLSKNTVKFTYSRNQYKVYVHFYKENTTEKVMEDAVVDFPYGETISITGNEIDGWLLSNPEKQMLTVSDLESENHVVFYYRRPLVDYTIICKEGGNVLRQETIHNAEAGEVTTVNAPEVTGYTALDPQTVSFTPSMDPSQNIVQFTYSRNFYKVYAHFYKEGTTERVVGDITAEMLYGGSFGVHAKAEYNGWVRIGPELQRLTVSAVPSENHMFFYYRQARVDYTITCIEDNEEKTIIHQETVSDVGAGDTITINAPTITGFTAKDPQSVSFKPSTNLSKNTVKFTYSRNQYKVYAHFYKENTTEKLMEDTVVDLPYGETISITGHEIDGWILSSLAEQTLTVSDMEGENHLIFYYSRPLVDYTIICKEGGNILRQETIRNAQAGEAITVNAPEITGFTALDPRSVNFTPSTGPSQDIIQFSYSRNRYMVYVHYVKQGTTEELRPVEPYGLVDYDSYVSFPTPRELNGWICVSSEEVGLTVAEEEEKNHIYIEFALPTSTPTQAVTSSETPMGSATPTPKITVMPSETLMGGITPAPEITVAPRNTPSPHLPPITPPHQSDNNNRWWIDEQEAIPLDEDEIGSYILDPETGEKEYMLFHTYDICMQWLLRDDLCAGYERCYHKE